MQEPAVTGMTVQLTAYSVMSTEGWTIQPAKLQRDWMDQTPMKAAYRCLPLTLANQAGWVVGCPCTFKATWTGRAADADALSFTFQSRHDEQHRRSIANTFGAGIISFVLPWLFRTSPGIGLWVRGPANSPKSDVSPLEGLVETDWSPYPFTMNWKIIRPKTDIWFKQGDPICMLTPFPIGMLEQVEPRQEPIDADPVLHANYEQAKERRMQSARELTAHKGQWELTYMRGYRPDGVAAPVHLTNLRLAKFDGVEVPGANPGAP
jgi:hypothetical protein